ncbi:vesicle-associated membrane protein 2 isoform X1 [Talpa occidentalis]|uniref:vesicle-associated membrane protein 2 isoform X1 n=1 Tax=Talpa occidentalis TaxID=50954 RepID=UPI0023F804D1|nr:vesicle-associated membrane protein 2 isoform X1 [Talpa occidentalis]
MSATAATAPPAAPAGEGGPPAPPPNLTSNRRLQQTQAQVDEVVDIMRVNVDKVLERDQKLSELDDRADALQAGASQFETSAAKLKRKYWWKNLKMMIILGVICAIILIIIIGTRCDRTSQSSEAWVSQLISSARPPGPLVHPWWPLHLPCSPALLMAQI